MSLPETEWVRCPKCGNLVAPDNLEPCSALNHDVPDFRPVPQPPKERRR